MPVKQSLGHQWKDLEIRFTSKTNSINFYDNVVVLEKDNIKTPREIRKWENYKDGFYQIPIQTLIDG